MTRPPIEDLDRKYGEATDGEWFQTNGGDLCSGVFPLVLDEPDNLASVLTLHNAWPQVSEYIRGLELELEETKRQLKIADDLRGEWKEQFFDAVKAERKMRAVVSSCRRLTHPRSKMPDAEKLAHIQRMTNEAAPPEILRVQKPVYAALGDTDE